MPECPSPGPLAVLQRHSGRSRRLGQSWPGSQTWNQHLWPGLAWAPASEPSLMCASCMGGQTLSEDGHPQPCQSGPVSHSILSSYRATTEHYSRSKSCKSSKRGIKTIELKFSDTNSNAGGAGGAGALPQLQQAHKASPRENIGKPVTYDFACNVASLPYRL